MSEESLKPKRRVRADGIDVEYQVVGSEDRFAATLGKLTVSGGLMRPGRPLEVGARIRVFIQPFDEDVSIGADEELSLRAVTRWDRQGSIGLQFWRAGEREVRILMEIIAASENAGSQKPTPTDPDASARSRK
ncbi:MAG: hypothetical protein EXR75_03365 [Myxococcales bacterium]|nr:hypothetical protein [Myxococcales bacterium]